jgi:hypothetical protein
MLFIDEKTIDLAIDAISDSDERYDKALASIESEQAELMAYLFAEDEATFNEEEKDFLLYLLLIIWESVRMKVEKINPIPLAKLSDVEEATWELLEASVGKKFRERLNPFFEHTKQEDLLAFVEDALLDDDDTPVTKEGREPMFVMLKAVIDCLDELNA